MPVKKNTRGVEVKPNKALTVFFYKIEEKML